MGVKSTVHLTRQWAISRAVEMHQQKERRKIEALYTAMTDKELEDILEQMNDERAGGEGFENYFIR
jgi:hypothetical protein